MAYLDKHKRQQVLVKKAGLRYDKLHYLLWKNVAMLNAIVAVLDEFYRLAPALRRSNSWQFLDMSVLALFGGP